MLVITRTENQSVTIGDDIEVVVMSIRSDRVRLGIIAPKSIRIERADQEGEEADRQVLAEESDIPAGGGDGTQAATPPE